MSKFAIFLLALAALWGSGLPSSRAETTAPADRLAGLPASAPYPSDAWLAQYPRDADGFTKFPIPASAVIVGDHPADAPNFKIAQAMAVANGSNCVLFRRGRLYTNSQRGGLGQINDNIQAHGTPDKPFIVGSVGDLSLPRPVLLQGMGVGGSEYGSGPIRYAIVFGLDFYGDVRDPASPTYDPQAPSWYQASGLRMVDSPAGSDHLWIEDCRWRYMGEGIELQSNKHPFATAIVRRCVIDHCRGEKFGLYAYHIKDFLLTDCVLDHDGWLEGGPVARKNIFTHDAYLQLYPDAGDPQTRVLNTIFARASATGCQQRSGGLNDNCAYIGDPIAGFIARTAGSTWSNSTVCAAGLDVSTGPNARRGCGVQLNLLPTGTLNHIICFDKPQPNNGDSGWAFELMCKNSDTRQNVPTEARLQNLIVHNWTSWDSGDGKPRYVSIQGTPGDVEYKNCDIPGYGDVTQPPRYADPDRTLASYAKSLHRPDITDAASFLDAADRNRRGAWDARLTAPAFNDYIFQGFQVLK